MVIFIRYIPLQMVTTLKSFFSTYIRIATILILAMSILTGCASPSAETAPTLDDSAVIAAAVETISAQMTMDAINNPSPTPVPTHTPLPPTATPLPPTETPAATLEPTAVPTQAAELSAKLVYVVTFPENKRIYVPNEKYGLALGFENTGSVTWAPGSYVKLERYQGEVTIQLQLAVDKAVKPGERVEFDLWVFGSETLGYHEFVFQLYTNDGLAIPGGVAVYSYTSV